MTEKFSGSGTIKFNGTTYRYKSATSFASIINITYTSPDSFQFPYQGFILKEGENDFSLMGSGYKIETSGVYYIMFKYTDEEVFTQDYTLFRLEILDSSTTFFYVTVDGNMISPQNSFYKDNGKQYSNYYIVNVNYLTENARVEIVPNQYQEVEIDSSPLSIPETSGATTMIYSLTNKKGESYPNGVSPYNDNVVITFVPPTSRPVTSIYYESDTGDQISLSDRTSISIVSNKESDFDQLKILWTPYYAIEQNKIKISALKDGHPFELETYNGDTFSYTILPVSGKYRLTFTDSSSPANVQTFGGRDYIEVTFLKDIHFTMIFTDNDGTEVETEAIDRGIFNKNLKLKIHNLSTYYSSASIGSGSNMIHVKRNGINYSGYSYNSSTTTFTFNDVGYYEVYFSATTVNGEEIREQTYRFTIVNPNESRHAFELSAFDGYTIEKIVKDNGISTSTLTKAELVGNAKNSLYRSTNDGNARYTVTVSTNKKLTISKGGESATDEITTFTFSFLIRESTPPVEVSIKEGSTSTSPISVSFNAVNILNAVGDCFLSVAGQTFEINTETAQSLGTQTVTITNAGTYFVQVYTESGNLLYSYKVVKKDPLNGWAIAAIAIGSIVFVAVLFIVFKLRKRIKSK